MSARTVLTLILFVNFLISAGQNKDDIFNKLKTRITLAPDSAMLIINKVDSMQIFGNNSFEDAEFMIYKSDIYKQYSMYTEAQKELFSAINIYLKKSAFDKQYITYFRIGELYNILGISEKAKENYYKAYKIAKNRDTYSAWNYYFSMIKLNISDRDYDIALSNLDTAANEFIPIDTTNTIKPMILNTKGIIFLWVKDFESSLNVLDSAIKINTSINDSISLAKNYTNIGRLYSEKRELNTAFHYFRKAYVIDSIKNNTKGLYIKGLNLASTLVYLNRYIEARNIYDKLLNTEEIKSNHVYMSRLHYSIAILYYHLDNSDLIEEHTNRAMEYANKTGDQSYISLILDLKSKNQFYFKKNKDRGYELLKESYMIANKTNSKNLAEAIKGYELKAKIIEQETKLNRNYLESENRRAELIIQRNITVLLLFIIVAVALIIIIRLRKSINANIKSFNRYKYIVSTHKNRYHEANTKIEDIEKEKNSINRIAEHTKNDMSKLILLIEESNKITQNCIKIVNKDISKSGLEKLTSNLKRLDNIISGNDIIKFHLDNEYSEFNVKLKEHFPNLTKGEEQLCTLIRYNYSTNQIASYTNTSQKTIEVARYRLRKKLGFENNNDFYSFLNSL
jgi:tetratricopeptide (TPR) repeat protein/DNA-binding CsgD family transcriptional regulator